MFRLDLATLPPNPVTRFAPSPTGLLHLGHVANAVWTWGIARAAGGRVLLRVEDHDRGRCRPEYERQLLADLAWLGLEPDADRPAAGPVPFVRQSDRHAAYHAALRELSATHSVYVCACSRRDIVRAHGLTDGPAGDELRYPGTCRALDLSEGPDRGIRVAIPDRAVSFDDLRHGTTRQHPAAQAGDLLLRDRHGNWTYQFCVVVDDHLQGVNLVVRGDDLLESTGRQILLAEMLGRTAPPAFLHHPLLFGEVPGVKLSKRDSAAGIEELRGAGYSSARVLGEAAYRTGLIASPREVGPADLAGLFA